MRIIQQITVAILMLIILASSSFAFIDQNNIRVDSPDSWEKTDPLGIDGGVNVYAYANLNPLAFVDYLGLCPDSLGRSVWNATKEVGIIAAGFVPYLGDAMDVYDVAAPGSSGAARTIGVASLGVNIWTAGLAPNAGPIMRGAGMVGDAFRKIFKHGDDIGQAVMRNSDEITTTLYHGGKLRGGTVQPSRISLTPDINHAQRYSDLSGGRIYQFDVPSSRLRQLESNDSVLRLRDSYLNTGSYADEFRFNPSVSPELNQYLRQ